MGNLHEDVFVGLGFDELTTDEFYRELFRYSDAYMKYGDAMQVPVTLSTEGGGTWRSCRLCDVASVVQDRNDAYISACTYFPQRGNDGKWRSRNGKDYADQLCAFVVDLDYGDPQAVRDYFYEAIEIEGHEEPPGLFWWRKDKPNPTYIVCSGRGMHFYYVLTRPVSMLKRWQKELAVINRSLYEPLKKEPVDTMSEISQAVIEGLGRRDYHGITQPYRVVGSLPKTGKSPVTAWKTGNPLELEELAKFAKLEQTVFEVKNFDMSQSLMAKEATGRKMKPYVKKTNRRGWNPGFYRWLAQREKDHMRLYGEYGHRYKQVQALTIASIKDCIPRDQLISDVREIHAGWNECARKYGHPEIGWKECEKAMRCFTDCPDHRHFPKWWLEDLCGWKFGAQKRNGRSQKEHLADARDWRDFKWLKKEGAWWDNAGRPKGVKDSRPRAEHPTPKKQLIRNYAAKHPEANHSEIARELGVSRPTVIKWLKE